MRTAMAILGTAILALGAMAPGLHAQTAADARETVAATTATTGGAAATSVPRLIQFSATLKDAAQRPVSGVASVTFAIYAEQDGGTSLWSETQNVLADASGHYNVLLGSATASGVPAELFATGASRWLGVTVARAPESPRVLLASVPYALKAGDADTLGGLPASSYVTASQLAARAASPLAGGSTTIVATPGAATAATSAPASSQSQNSVPQTGVDVTGAGTADYVPLWTSGSNIANSILFQNASRIGVGTTTPVVTLDVNGDSIFRGSFQLVPQGTATASTGQLSHSYQWEASTYDSTTSAPVTTAFGFRATPQGNNTSNPTSSLDLYYGPGGGTLTDTGFSFNNAGIVTFAPGQTFTSNSATFTELNLPNTSSGTAGVITLGGAPFINDFGSPTNTFVGNSAGGNFESSNANGGNVGVGSSALASNTSGYGNTAIGAQSLLINTQGISNTAVGDGALSQNQVGNYNTAIGLQAGATNMTGTHNTLLGLGADVSVDGLTNATAIGTQAIVGASNTIVLGSIAGVGNGSSNVNVGIGTSTPRSVLELSSAGGASHLLDEPPAPILTLTNTLGTQSNQVAIDFNTYGPSSSGTYNPAARISAYDAGNYSDYLYFWANKPGSRNGGLSPTMIIDPYGDVTIYGNVVKASGSFKIDDPIDPANKYLSHSFVESPDMMNIYNGNVVTDAKGYATVAMPAWFEALNRDFRYQLTPMNSFARATVTREMKDGKFRIRTSRPNVKVSWQVTGIRHDAWANAHRIPNEEEKPANEQGHYMHPELFGAGPDKAIAAAHSPAMNAAGSSDSGASTPASPAAANSASHTADGQR